MSVHQMLCHLDDSYKLALGDKTASPATGLVQRTVLKWAALKAPVQWSHGFPTPPGDGTRERGHSSGWFPSGSRSVAFDPEPVLRCLAKPMLVPSDIRENDHGGLDALGIFACGSPPAPIWQMSGAKKTPLIFEWRSFA